MKSFKFFKVLILIYCGFAVCFASAGLMYFPMLYIGTSDPSLSTYEPRPEIVQKMSEEIVEWLHIPSDQIELSTQAVKNYFMQINARKMRVASDTFTDLLVNSVRVVSEFAFWLTLLIFVYKFRLFETKWESISKWLTYLIIALAINVVMQISNDIYVIFKPISSEAQSFIDLPDPVLAGLARKYFDYLYKYHVAILMILPTLSLAGGLCLLTLCVVIKNWIKLHLELVKSHKDLSTEQSLTI
jgi:hypothetical protein